MSVRCRRMTDREVIADAERAKRASLTTAERKAALAMNRHSPRVICNGRSVGSFSRTRRRRRRRRR
jgi:hypothetical protein